MKKRKLTITVLLLAGMIIFCQGADAAQENIRSKISFRTDPLSSDSEVEFSPYDTVHSLVTLYDLKPGRYTAAVNWIDPTGNINQNSIFTFTLQDQTVYTLYTWLRLMENGPLKRTLGGKTFDDEYIGEWELHVFINSTMLEKKSFTLR